MKAPAKAAGPVSSKDASILALRKALTKQYGDLVISFNPNAPIQPIPVISTGFPLVDAALGVGGFPRGRIAELFGLPSSGKSTLAMRLVAQCQALGEPALWLDHEDCFDLEYAKLLGVDVSDNKLILVQPGTLEDGISIAETCLLNNLVGVVVFDSLASMRPKKELEGTIEDTQVALQARMISKALMRLTPMASNSKAAVVFLNHLKEAFGGYGAKVGGPAPKTTPGGRSLKYYSSVRVEMAMVQTITGKVPDILSGGLVDGPAAWKFKATVVKNKVGPPFRSGTFYLKAGVGADYDRTLLDIAEARKLITRNGPRVIFPMFPSPADAAKPLNLLGLEGALRWLRDNPDKRESLNVQVMALLRSRGPETPVEDVDDDPEDDDPAADEFLATPSPTASGGSYSIGFGASDDDSA